MLTFIQNLFKMYSYIKTYGYNNGIGIVVDNIPGMVSNRISDGLINEIEIVDGEIVPTGKQYSVSNMGGQLNRGELVLFSNVKGKLVTQTSRFILADTEGSGTGTGTGTGSGRPHYTSIKLVRPYKDVLGVGFHRSGWPFVFQHLSSINHDNGILFDDFIEQNFSYRHNPVVYMEPWVGVFHHPPNIPYFGNDREKLDVIFNKAEFKESLKHLKLAISLSEHLSIELRRRLDCPVVTLKHPCHIPSKTWRPELFRANAKKQLVQVGYYLRNTRLISQIPDCEFAKTKLWLDREWIKDYDRKIVDYWNAHNNLIAGQEYLVRGYYPTYENRLFVSPGEYDKLLCQNIVVMELFDASANNGVLDCIVRNTPLIINRHPAVEEYLGKDYPLYFQHPREIPDLAKKALEGHEYLSKMDKSWLSPTYFINGLLESLATI